MNIEAMIKRRQRQDGDTRLIKDHKPLSPVFHVDEPVDRGRLLERLLDHFDPVFDGHLPPHGYLYGPMGTGKSAAVTALFRHLNHHAGDPQTAIYTRTRVRPARLLRFAYVDTRRTTSEFELYHALLDTLTDDRVPKHGISTDTLRRRLYEKLDSASAGLLLAVDHVGEPGSVDADTLVKRFSDLPSNVSWLAVGRIEPTETVLTDYTAASIRVHPYRLHALVNVLLSRTASGLNQPGLGADVIQQIAEWADGNAHDALAALFIAADRADQAGRETLTDEDVISAIGTIPDPCVSLARVFALPANKQAVLRALVDLDPIARESVSVATTAITRSTVVDLSDGTIKRYLYEMATAGVIERVRSEADPAQGRPPSRLEARFPPTVFRRLYDIERAQ